MVQPSQGLAMARHIGRWSGSLDFEVVSVWCFFYFPDMIHDTVAHCGSDIVASCLVFISYFEKCRTGNENSRRTKIASSPSGKTPSFGPIRLWVLYPNSSQSLRTLLVLRKQQKYMYYYGEIELLYNLVLFILILLEL